MKYKQLLNRNIRLSYLVNFLTELIFVIPIWVAFLSRKLSFVQISLLYAISDLLMIGLELPTGALADLIGRKKTIIIGWLLRGISTAYVAIAGSWLQFLASGLVGALGKSLISGSDSALIYDSHKELGREATYSKYVSRVGLVVRLALVVGIFAGGYLYKLWPGLPYILQGLMQFLAGLVVLLMVEPKIDSVKFTLPGYVAQTVSGLKQLSQNNYIKKLSLFYTIVGGITWSCVYYFNQPFASELGFSEVSQSWLFAIVYFLASIFIFIIAEKEHRFSRQTIYFMFPVVMFLSFLPAFWVNRFWSFFIFAGTTFASSSRFAFLERYTNEEFQSKYRATAISSLNMLVSILTILLITVGGKVQDMMGNKIIFIAMGMMSLLVVMPLSLSLVKEYKLKIK